MATVEQEVQRLMQFDANAQYQVLGLRAKHLQLEASGGDLAELQGPPEALIEFGKNWWKSFSSQVYTKICDPKGEWHAPVLDAARKGSSSVGIVLATSLVGVLGIAPPLAAAIGALVASQYFKDVLQMGGEAAVTAFCQTVKPQAAAAGENPGAGAP
jgi:hypothetical protein